MSLIQSKDDDDEEEVLQKANPRLLGLGLMAGAGCFLTIGNVIVQYAHKKWGENISTFEILFIRSLIQLVFIVAFMGYGKVGVYGKSLRNLIVLSIMGIAEVTTDILPSFLLTIFMRSKDMNIDVYITEYPVSNSVLNASIVLGVYPKLLGMAYCCWKFCDFSVVKALR